MNEGGRTERDRRSLLWPPAGLADVRVLAGLPAATAVHSGTPQLVDFSTDRSSVSARRCSTLGFQGLSCPFHCSPTEHLGW